MTEPIRMDIPHSHPRGVVRERLDAGVQKVAALFPGGAVASHRWEGDTLHFTIAALGQQVASRIDLFDSHVHCEIDLPPFLAMFADRIRAKLAKEAPLLFK